MSKKPLPDAAGFGSTLGDLLKARGFAPAEAPAAPAPAAAPSGATAPDPLDLAPAGKLVVRREHKGRGGKTVTVITGLPEAHLDALCKALKTQMGCGATVEAADVVLQGDQVARVLPWLTARGARQVVRGN
ncbi:translation initiation factor [Myxococcota bacterium]|nr:translation initiation factor [Myxococcota bacterium]